MSAAAVSYKLNTDQEVAGVEKLEIFGRINQNHLSRNNCALKTHTWDTGCQLIIRDLMFLVNMTIMASIVALSLILIGPGHPYGCCDINIA
ncbi:unnamed protein product [Amoebophrya sp. A25]|nr:unnamed protein product [Amoebophrya sp. A25]|eukprot:GSA25T00023433001.1